MEEVHLRRRGAHISYSSLFFIRMDTHRHVLPVEINRTLQEYFKSTCILQNSEICAGRHRRWLAMHRTRSCWDGWY